MNILVLNSGSSSIKFSVFASTQPGSPPELLLDGNLSGIGTPSASLSITRPGQPEQSSSLPSTEDSAAAITSILDAIRQASLAPPAAVGYRVVHPGPHISDHVRITPAVLEQLTAAAAFAPLHDPQAVEIIRQTMQRLPAIPHFACFDTVFHQTMPEEASTYPIPEQYRAQGVRRYGFHGLSCESIVRQLPQLTHPGTRAVIAHLGSGCSVTALLAGKSIDTTMGLTPDGGVVMGTRPGDLDPGLILYLLRQQHGDDPASATEGILNHQSGIVALSGLPNDMKAVRKAATAGDAAALLALKIFTRSIRKAIGSFAWLLGGLDTLVFTGGIGEHDSASRAEILAGTPVRINSSSNLATSSDPHQISASDSATTVFVAPAQEDLVIALHVLRML